MKIETVQTITTIRESQFLPRFVRYFAVSSMACGAVLFCFTIYFLFVPDVGLFQCLLSLLLSAAAILYGVYLLFLFPDVLVEIDRKKGSVSISSQRMFDKDIQTFELRRIVRLVMERSESATGKNIYRMIFFTFKGEKIPLSGSWSDDVIRLEADAKEIHSHLDAIATLDFPKYFLLDLEEKRKAEKGETPEPSSQSEATEAKSGELSQGSEHPEDAKKSPVEKLPVDSAQVVEPRKDSPTRETN